VSQKSLDSVGHTLNVECQMNYAALCTLCVLYVHFTEEGWNFNSGNYLFTTDTK